MESKKFIEKAKVRHGNKYDYSKFEEKPYNEKVCIICPEHGEFWQIPSKHIAGQGCPKCAHPNTGLTPEEFIEKASKIHKFKYVYKEINFSRLTDKVEIICPIHGEFKQSVKEHLNGQGCPKCRYDTIAEKRRLTKDEFVEKAISVHGGKYDYSKVEYVNYITPVCIICPIHGEFWQRPNEHLQGQGCSKCSGRYQYTTEEWIDKAREMHGDKYDYSKTEYKDVKTKVCIICPEHGEFWQLPSAHLNGEGCPKCGRKKCAEKLSSNNVNFIKKAKEIHENKYDYTKVNYINNRTPVCIICPEHGEFWQTPAVHLRGNGCTKCGIEKNRILSSLTTEEFIEKARRVHADKYDYSKTVYISGDKDVCVICPEHGEFWINASRHLNGQQCGECSRLLFREKRVLPFDEMVKKAQEVHGNKYVYDKSSYVQCSQKMRIICPEHGEFWQTPNDHIGQGHRCPKCACNLSNGEKELREFISQYENIIVGDRNILNGKEIDMFIPSKKIGFEYNGVRWHSEQFNRNRYYHLDKTDECNKKGIRLIHIFEDEYLEHKELVYDKIKQTLGLNKDKERVGARKIKIMKIEKNVTKEFLDNYHIQGFVNSTIYYGAFYKGNIVGVMSFKRESKNSEKWELTRFATDYHYSCPGLGSKMFQHFIREYNPTEVKSFADRRWTLDKDNNLYIKMGFKLEKICKPDYRYAVGNKRIHKFNMRKQILHRKYGLPLTMTEKEMCDELGFHRIWDCGLFKYVWKRE